MTQINLIPEDERRVKSLIAESILYLMAKKTLEAFNETRLLPKNLVSNVIVGDINKGDSK